MLSECLPHHTPSAEMRASQELSWFILSEVLGPSTAPGKGEFFHKCVQISEKLNTQN